MFNESLCNSSGILNIIYLIKTALNIIKIAAPIILLVMCMIDVVKMIVRAEVKVGDLIKKIINRALAAVLIFFAIPLINTGMSLLGNHTSLQLSKCWTNAEKETIASLKVSEDKAAREEEENMTKTRNEEKEQKRKDALNLRTGISFKSSTSDNGGIMYEGTPIGVIDGTCVNTGRPYASGVDIGAEIIKEANSYVGKIPYDWGGTSLETGVDCSGFTQQILLKFGAQIPRVSDAQGGVGQRIESIADAKPGDIIVYPGHVGFYAGNNQLLAAIDDANDLGYQKANYAPIITIRRIICNG
ncbi:MAG: NlpC/P60 family protein [Bacilli bacterium]|nr:NlpC/P60 family protein [Bacilli bacterium]